MDEKKFEMLEVYKFAEKWKKSFSFFYILMYSFPVFEYCIYFPDCTLTQMLAYYKINILKCIS